MALSNIIIDTDFSQPFSVFSGTPETRQKLNEMITVVQFQFLRKLLGSKLLAELETDNFAAAKWTNFRDGVTYQKDTFDIIYTGIKGVLANRTYFYYNRWLNTVIAENSDVRILQNSELQVVPRYKMVDAWNESINLIQDDYKEYSPSIYNYLNDTDGFDNWKYTEFEKINIGGF